MNQAAKDMLQAQHLEIALAANANDVEKALRLRYRVFVEEEKNMMMRNDSGIETDAYDEFCDHLIVKDLETEEVIGTYRLLPPERAVSGIGFYSETEFDLSGFGAFKPKALEVGRSCIMPEYRNGRAIQMLWEGIAKYIAERNYEFLIGCASVHFKQKTDLNEVVSLLRKKGIINESYGIKPLETHRIHDLKHVELPEELEKEVFRKLPPLMKGYQWLGADIGGVPAFDPVFDTVDFFIVLNKDKISRRYKRHFIKD